MLSTGLEIEGFSDEVNIPSEAGRLAFDSLTKSNWGECGEE